jgi:2-oxo-4-hydroxy-4-carboxy-5-ureidoimidazoline decarboxylase
MWRAIDRATDAEARTLLLSACGSSRWIRRMLDRRPFGSQESLLTAARDEWAALGEDDWREAFQHHPAIGDLTSLRERFPATHQHSTREQAGVQSASDDALRRLADGNRRYRERFGYTFIVCATGKSAEEMLSLLEARLDHDHQVEIQVAAEEQAKITALRLRRADWSG